jgi:glycine hydroxymethyltransferase
MIPSENFVSEAVLEAMGSVFTNKYAEGQPGKRYYGGCEVSDELETLTKDRATQLFGAEFANVQVHSGATANQAVFEAFIEPGDTVMGLRLDHGGHLTHGLKVNFSGRHYNIVSYGVLEESGLIDYDQVLDLAKREKPKLIIAGASAYSRQIDFARFREAADSCGAVLLSDVAHYAGLIAAGQYPSPVPFSEVVTTTTHKTLRGPRSGLILARKEFAARINRAVFPGLQGGPHMHTIAAKAVGFLENKQPSFTEYAKQIIANSRALASELTALGHTIVTGGTDSHLMLVDVRPAGVSGKVGADLLGTVGITCNMNTIPFDPEPPTVCSGIRLGTPALTTRGMREADMKAIASLITRTFESRDQDKKLSSLAEEVKALSGKFPLYRHRLVQ